MSYEITRKITVDAGHRVPNHSSMCRNLHGHTYTVHASMVASEVVEQSQNPQEGMVTDFSFLKSGMMRAIHQMCDHHTILVHDDPLLLSLVDTSLHSIRETIITGVEAAFSEALKGATEILKGSDYSSSARQDAVMYAEEHMRVHAGLFFESHVYTEPTDAPLLQLLDCVMWDIINDQAEPENVNVYDYLKFSNPGSTPMLMFIGLLRMDSRPMKMAALSLPCTSLLLRGKENTQLYITSFVPTAENLARHWGERLKIQMRHDPNVPSNVRVSRVLVWETPNCSAEYVLPNESVSL